MYSCDPSPWHVKQEDHKLKTKLGLHSKNIFLWSHIILHVLAQLNMSQMTCLFFMDRFKEY